MKDKTLERLATGTIVFSVVAYLAIMALIIFVAVHFITKWW